MITKETIQEFFRDVNSGNEFNTSDILLWGYFFLDPDKAKLEKAGNKLAKKGYKFVEIFDAEKEDESDPQEYYLHVERIEKHDEETLYKRNKELYIFAEENDIMSYDGFDVGNIMDSENIVK